MKTTGWFAMIRHQKGFPMPLVDENEDVALFNTEEEASAAARRTLMGETFGYEIYEWVTRGAA